MPQSGLQRINRTTATAVNKRWVPFLPRWMLTGGAAPKPHISSQAEKEVEVVPPPEEPPGQPGRPPIRPGAPAF